jgi:hypothetical protein
MKLKNRHSCSHRLIETAFTQISRYLDSRKRIIQTISAIYKRNSVPTNSHALCTFTSKQWIETKERSCARGLH